ncbi:multicopper oxidase domain-containing protein [Flaviflexus huanghaiensis]|uniref:multicopper oxidase domain-containing protein n=1 Tax=Flaviflexus huanghaiensis TaxID=1111473 RepID=UPI0015F9F967|nr:multicopper oxidase domain-containing protein [Flaviflexus huanghaiensis]
MAPRSIWHRGTATLVIFWMAIAAAAITAHRFIPEATWIMVHTFTLGVVTNALLIWTNHFTVAVLRSRPESRRGEAATLALLNAGITTLGIGMIAGNDWVAGGASLVIGVAILTHILRLWGRLKSALPARFEVAVHAYLAAAVLFIPGIILGYLLSLDSWQPATSVAIRGAHVALNVLAWVGIPIVGTLLTLWPTILRAKLPPGAETVAKKRLPLLIGAALVAASGSLLIALTPLGGIISGLGYLGFAASAILMLAPLVGITWKMAGGSYAALSVAAGALWLLGTIVFIGLQLLFVDPLSVIGNFGPIVLPLLAGGVAQVVLGALSYLLPVVIGGGPKHVRVRNARADAGAAWRIIVLNASLTLYIISEASLVLVFTSLAALVAAVGTVWCLIWAILPVREKHLHDAPPPMTDREGNVTPVSPQRGPILFSIGAVALLVIGAVAADPASSGIVRPSPSGTTTASPVDASGEVTAVEVDMVDMRYVPDLVTVPAGNTLELTLTNSDGQSHDLVLENGFTSGRIAPGETVVLDLGVMNEDVDGWCSVAGHRQMGMVFTIDVGDQGTDPGARSDAGDHGMDMGGAQPDAADPSFDLMGEMDEGRYMDPALEPIDSDEATEHRVTFTVSEMDMEVAPGLTQNLWLFNETMPGPTLHGKVGDTFVITLVNDGSMGHSIDFHAGALAPDRPMRTIEPGEELTYTFTAERAGVWMYHCSTAPMSLHIANGMYGAVVIEPPDLPEVDHQFVMVHGESYYGPAGDVADSGKIADGDHDTAHYNGYPNQYVQHPLEVKTGERVRFWVLDAGPNVATSFHIVGGQFDTVWKEGSYLLGPEEEIGGSQALGLLPAEGGFVELVFPEAGHYTLVNHIMSEAERGAKGTIRVTDR